MFINPSQMADEWDIRPGMKVADFGCGSGHHSIELAKRIGKDGRVYAFDVQEEALSALKSRMSAAHLYNIEFRRTDLDMERSTRLDDNILDIVVFSNVLFQLEKKETAVREAYRILRPGGRAIVIDWEEAAGPLGPVSGQRISKEAAQNIFLGAGFSPDREVDAEEHHYGLIFRK